MRSFSKTDWHEDTVVKSHNSDVYTTTEKWPEVEKFLLEEGVPSEQLEPPHRTERYGLVRLSLDPKVSRAGLSLNYLVGFGVVELDDEVTGQPKIIGSALDDRTPSVVALPPRVIDGPGTGVTVGVVDTGFRRHEWIRGACTYQADDLEYYAQGRELIFDISGHGLFVAGLILEQAPGATVRMERVLSADGHGEAIDVHDAICRLATAGCQIINLSLGCFTEHTDPDTGPLVLRHAIDWARSYQAEIGRTPDDIVFVAAAGNTGGSAAADDANRPFWPAAFNDVWAVASAQRDDTGDWRVSDFSANAAWVDAAAPGSGVISTWTPWETRDTEAASRWASWSGTSFAAAVASGVLARAYARPGPQSWPALATPGETVAKELTVVITTDNAALCVLGSDTLTVQGSDPWS